VVQSQPVCEHIVHRDPIKNTQYKKGLVEWLKVKVLSSNPSTRKKNSKVEKKLL
jgi:hypothetical protein